MCNFKTDICNYNCRDGPGKLQNLSENPPLEASPCQEDQLKVISEYKYINTNTQMHTIMHMLVIAHLRLSKIAHVSDFDFVWLLSSFCFEKLASHIYSHLIRKQLWKKRRFGKVGFCAVAQRECSWIVGRAILVKRQLLLSSVCSRDVTIGRILPQKAPVQNTLLVLT